MGCRQREPSPINAVIPRSRDRPFGSNRTIPQGPLKDRRGIRQTRFDQTNEHEQSGSLGEEIFSSSAASLTGAGIRQMRQQSITPAHEIISIGAFQLLPTQRLLLKGDETVKIGSRAFDILHALAERPGEVISQKELLAKVWPDVFVEEVSLRVHMAALRKVLEDGTEKVRYLANVPGRGYSLVAPTSKSRLEQDYQSDHADQSAYFLPSPPDNMVGRDREAQEIAEKLRSRRFVTIAGPGGVGKTTVALSVANALLADFVGEVAFVDLSPLTDAGHLAATVASAFRLPARTKDPILELAAHLRGKKVLLVLDSCEHLIAKAAAVAQRLFENSHGLYILATSREALRAEGEHIHLLPTLPSPPEQADITVSEALAYPAAQLFVNRLTSAGFTSSLTDEEARTVGEMCRKLGGIALAIELAAGRVGVYGIRETAALLNSRFALLWPGRRTAPPRHQTLHATLDWSYNLLSETERAVLRRLSVFAGGFTLDAGQQVAAKGIGEEQMLDALSGLCAKSLTVIDRSDKTARYRLLDTTRSYARRKLEEAGELEYVRRRHAVYYCELLWATTANELSSGDAVTASATDLDDIRAALRWAFEDGGDPVLGGDIAAYSAPLWLSRALLIECRGWMAKALSMYKLTDGAVTQQQLRIQIAFASTELFTTGFTQQTIAAWKRTLDHANALGDLPAKLLSYLAFWGGEIRAAQYLTALNTAEKCAALVSDSPDAGSRAMGEWLLGHSKHHVGRFEEARTHLRRYFVIDTEAARMASIKITGYDRRIDALSILSNTLWVLGLPDQAKTCGDRAISEARSLGFAIPAGIAMSWAGLNTYLSDTDINVIERDMVELLDQSRIHSIHSDSGLALCIMGICQANRGKFDDGAGMVAEGLRVLARVQLEAFSTFVRAHTCEAAIVANRIDDALFWMTQLERYDDDNREHWCSAEVLRVQGLLAQAQGNDDGAIKLLLQAIRLSRSQKALSWELRAAVSLSRMWASRNRAADALNILQPLYGQFHEGFATSDLIRAKRLIDELAGPVAGARI